MLENLLSKIDTIAEENTIPTVVVEDVKFRITDWIHSGGLGTDRYVENQFKVLDRFIAYNIKRAES